MKNTILISLLLISGSVQSLLAQFQFQLKESAWEGTHSPLSHGTEIFFYADTMSIVDLDGINPPDLYLFKEKHDTLQLEMISEYSVSCREEVPGYYRIIRSNNGEKLLLKPIPHGSVKENLASFVPTGIFYPPKKTKLPALGFMKPTACFV